MISDVSINLIPIAIGMILGVRCSTFNNLGVATLKTGNHFIEKLNNNCTIEMFK